MCMICLAVAAYPTEPSLMTADGVHYAELSFAAQQHPTHQSQKSPQQQSVEYAKIEFAKTQRVNLIGGSPKFESTVWFWCRGAKEQSVSTICDSECIMQGSSIESSNSFRYSRWIDSGDQMRCNKCYKYKWGNDEVSVVEEAVLQWMQQITIALVIICSRDLVDGSRCTETFFTAARASTQRCRSYENAHHYCINRLNNNTDLLAQQQVSFHIQKTWQQLLAMVTH